MSNAVLTITCPNCGGKVSGVLATNVHQTVPCTYCSTSFHVPRVGEVVVREIVHERVVVQETTYDLVPNVMLYPRRKAQPGMALALMLFTGFVGIIMLMAHASSSSTVDDFDRREAAERSCKDSCPQQCIHAADNVQPAPETDDPELKQMFADGDRIRSETAMTICTTTCEAKCMGIDLGKP